MDMKVPVFIILITILALSSCNPSSENRKIFIEKLETIYNSKNIIQLDTVFFDKEKLIIQSSDTSYFSRAYFHYFFLGYAISETNLENELNIDSLEVHFSASDSIQTLDNIYAYSDIYKNINILNTLRPCKRIYSILYDSDFSNDAEFLMDQYLGYSRGNEEFEYKVFYINKFLMNFCIECSFNQKNDINKRIYLDTLLNMRDIYDTKNYPSSLEMRNEVRGVMTELINYGFKSIYVPKGADIENTKIYIDSLNNLKDKKKK